jgi:hypothetical protein
MTALSPHRRVRAMRSPAAGPRAMIPDLSLLISPSEHGRHDPEYKSYEALKNRYLPGFKSSHTAAALVVIVSATDTGKAAGLIIPP